MRRRRPVEFRPVTLTLPDFDPALRATPDDDPLVEEMVERLRAGLGGLVAVDPWGRPTAWRDVVRVALGPALAELRDARTARVLAAAAEQRAVPDTADAADAADALPEPSGLGRHAAPSPLL